MKKLDSRTIVKLCRDTAEDKKAIDSIIFDVRKVSSIADYFMICSGNSEPHLKAIADEITRRLRDAGVRPRHHAGFPQSRWVVLDYGDVLIHVFHPELRERYDLEHLWGDAKRVK
ncbi:MAG: ribosome silencing factor [Verrucomicrobiota bacterium]